MVIIVPRKRAISGIAPYAAKSGIDDLGDSHAIGDQIDDQGSEIRMPRIHAFPPGMAGSAVMRSKPNIFGSLYIKTHDWS
jgi:hypothetical protein